MEEDNPKQPPPAAPMKFSFSVAKSSSSSRPPLFPKADQPKEADDVEFVSEFDGKGRSRKAPVKVIPLPEKSWRPEKRMKNIMVASENLPSTEDRFETETLAAGPQHSVQYGLQLRKPTEETLETSEAAMESVQDRDSQRLREDLALLPDEASLDAYDDVPVEEFGKALLRGMGWESGKPIGRNSTTVAVPIEPARRVGREGLGAIPAPQPEKVKKYIKPGESRKTKLTVGRVMCVIAGTYAGSRGQIAEVSGSSYVVALLESGKRVQVKEDELAEVGSSEEEKARKKLSGLHIERDNDSEMGFHQHVHSTDNGRKRDLANDRETRRDGRSSGEDMEAQHGERRNDRYKKDERSRSSREEGKHAYNAGDSKKSNRRDSRDENRDYDKRGNQDALDSRHEKHRSRREERKAVNDEKEHHEATASRQGRHSRGKESPARDVDKSMSDNKYGRKDTGNRREDARGDSSEDYYQEKSRSSKLEGRTKSMSAKGGSGEGPAVVTVGYGNTGVQSWLARDIRVRIIDKRAYGEKLYLQKACVVDVVSPSVCDIQIDNGGRIIQEVKQEHLETALPKRGGRVLVVGGKHQGQVGKLQERDSDKGVGLVQMEDNYEVLSIDLDNLAEFVGALHEMEQ